MGHPELRLLYVTPESLFKKDYEPCFRKAYEQKQIARFVIDEAHVLHEWGNGFRPVSECTAEKLGASADIHRNTRRSGRSSDSIPASRRL